MNSRRFPVPFSFPARRRRRRPGGGWRSPQAGTESAKGVATSSVAVKRIGITRSGRRGRFGDSLSNADVDATAFSGPTPTAHRAFQLWQGPAMCTCLAQLGTGFATKRPNGSDAWARIASGSAEQCAPRHRTELFSAPAPGLVIADVIGECSSRSLTSQARGYVRVLLRTSS